MHAEIKAPALMSPGDCAAHVLGNELLSPAQITGRPTDAGRRSSRYASSCQAARTESRNFVTSSLSRLLSPESICAADSTCEDADPVSPAPRWTSPMLLETCWVPWAACCTLREISCVAAPCSSTAAAIA